MYVAQIDEDQLADALRAGEYLEATREVLQRNGGLWFQDESFVVVRRSPRANVSNQSERDPALK